RSSSAEGCRPAAPNADSARSDSPTALQASPTRNSTSPYGSDEVFDTSEGTSEGAGAATSAGAAAAVVSSEPPAASAVADSPSADEVFDTSETTEDSSKGSELGWGAPEEASAATTSAPGASDEVFDTVGRGWRATRESVVISRPRVSM